MELTRRGFIGVGTLATAGSVIGRPIRSSLGSFPSSVDGEKLPYDSEVEYLESTGTQYIDTGCAGHWIDTVVTLDMILFSHSENESDFFGAANFGSATTDFNYAGGFNSIGFVLQLGLPYIKYGVQDTLRHVHRYDSINKTASLDGRATSGSSLVWTRNINAPNFGILQRTSLRHPSHNRLYRATIERGFVLIRDYIPVRITNEYGELEGCMYDRVSGELFRNSGSGSFIVGPDV